MALAAPVHRTCPAVPDVPLTNYAGWLVATLVLSALVQTAIGSGGAGAADDTLGVGLYLWSWVSWTVALAVFLGQPAAAAWGAVAMGTVAVPLLTSGAGRGVLPRLRHRRWPSPVLIPTDGRH